MDYFLSPAGAKHIPEMHRISNLPSSEDTDALLLGYCMEGIRLAGTFGSYRETAVDDVITEDDGRQVPVKAHDRVFVSFVSDPHFPSNCDTHHAEEVINTELLPKVGAAKDPNHFPDPESVNPRRPLDSYIHFGAGPHTCPGLDAAQTALTEMFRSVFRLKNVRRAPGPQGELKKVTRPGDFHVYMREDRGAYFPFPCTMKICYD